MFDVFRYAQAPEDVVERYRRLPPSEQQCEAIRTREVMAELLRQPRRAFPAVPVLWRGELVFQGDMEDCMGAIALARQEAARTGAGFDPLAVLRRALLAVLARRPTDDEIVRPPLPSGYGDRAREGLPRGNPLVAPLILDRA
ncbi:hypothetical protein ACX4MT_20115 [Roseomonas mucosa]